MGAPDHRASARKVGPLACSVLTVSDSRSEATDESGQLIQGLVAEAGHRVAGYALIRNEPRQIEESVGRFLDGPCQCLIVTGGTGAGRRDVTVETVTPLLEKVLPGFGELFRWLSFQEIGTAAMLSRALLGTRNGKVICCLPGSTAAVKLGVEKLLLPELAHLVWGASR
jgi:molybdenum cofactor biosynthesis protein B